MLSINDILEIFWEWKLCNILYIIDKQFGILILFICYEFIGMYFYHKSRAAMITYNCQFDTMVNQV